MPDVLVMEKHSATDYRRRVPDWTSRVANTVDRAAEKYRLGMVLNLLFVTAIVVAAILLIAR